LHIHNPHLWLVYHTNQIVAHITMIISVIVISNKNKGKMKKEKTKKKVNEPFPHSNQPNVALTLAYTPFQMLLLPFVPYACLPRNMASVCLVRVVIIFA